MLQRSSIRAIWPVSLALLSFILKPSLTFADPNVVTGCGQVLSQSGKYVLTGDLLGCTSNPSELGALIIAVSDIQLDLQGHQIVCSRTDDFANSGIVVLPNLSNITIKNGEIDNCDVGIFAVGPLFTGAPGLEGSIIRNMRLVNNLPDPVIGGGWGLLLDSANNLKIVGNYFSGNLQGLLMFNSDNNRISKNEFINNFGTGLEAVGSPGFGPSENNQIICNKAVGNGRGGFALVGDMVGNTIHRNQAIQNTVGIGLFSSALNPDDPADNVVSNNNSHSNAISDLVEANVDPVTLDFTPGEFCLNNWRNNKFVTEIGPETCIGQSIVFEDADSCGVDGGND